MSLEYWSTFASIGTFVVIAATAIAALVQLRHLRSSNQIAALNEVREAYESPRFNTARLEMEAILDKLSDPAVRTRAMQSPLPPELWPVSHVGNLFEGLGALVKYGVIDTEIVCDIWSGVIQSLWHRMLPFVAIRRRVQGNQVYGNFEYLTVLTEDFGERHTGSAYPRGVRRLPVPDPWLEEDTAAGIIPKQS